MADQIPLINGQNYAWGNITMVLFGVPVVGISKIEYKSKQGKENIYGFGTEPISRGYGNKEYEGSIEILVDELLRISDAVVTKDILDIPPFSIQVVYGGSRVVPRKDVLTGVEFLENPFSSSQGDTSIKITVPIIFAGLKRS